MSENIVLDPKLAALCLAVQYVYECRVNGDIIEFGVKSGNTARALIKGILDFEGPFREPDYPNRKLWLCDSFEGFPKPTHPTDLCSPNLINSIWYEGGSKGCSADECIQGMKQSGLGPEQYEVVVGWYKDTWPQFSNNNVALVHADCDLYESTIDALWPLFARQCISPGCIIMFDDWNAAHASNYFGQRRAWKRLVEHFEIDADDEGGYAAFSHKFIVHTYKARADEVG